MPTGAYISEDELFLLALNYHNAWQPSITPIFVQLSWPPQQTLWIGFERLDTKLDRPVVVPACPRLCQVGRPSISCQQCKDYRRKVRMHVYSVEWRESTPCACHALYLAKRSGAFGCAA